MLRLREGVHEECDVSGLGRELCVMLDVDDVWLPQLKGLEIPIYIWYDSYPTHSGEGYEGRVSRVSPDSPYGLASLNLTNIRESDQGWYECKVVFLNRSPNSHKNGTWFHLDVHGEYKSSKQLTLESALN